MGTISIPDLTTTVNSYSYPGSYTQAQGGTLSNPMGYISQAAGLGVGILNSLINYSNSKRDFNYQKDLQERIFNREDNAVQRRVADLKAAGLNPALAMGSAAGAGSVVGRSETPKQDFGSALDAMAAAMQIKQQVLATEAQRRENQILALNEIKARADAYNASYESDMTKEYFEYMFGLTPDYRKDKPFFRMIENDINQSDYNTSILKKSNDWYTANQVINAATNVFGAVSKFNPKNWIKRNK